MNIKGRSYTFKDLSIAHNAQEFQTQIDIIQENIKNCRRDIDNFDVYRITRAIADLRDIDAVKAKLLPGEAAVISAPTQGKWHTGQVIIRINNLEYVEVEPFQTGTYYPAAINEIMDGDNPTSNYLLTYAFTATPPLAGSHHLTNKKCDNAYEEFTATVKSEDQDYYYGFVNGQENNQAEFLLPVGDAAITFDAHQTRPILKFFIIDNFDTAEAQTHEEVSLAYSLSLNSTTNKYTLTVNDYPEHCYVAVK